MAPRGPSDAVESNEFAFRSRNSRARSFVRSFGRSTTVTGRKLSDEDVHGGHGCARKRGKKGEKRIE